MSYENIFKGPYGLIQISLNKELNEAEKDILSKALSMLVESEYNNALHNSPVATIESNILIDPKDDQYNIKFSIYDIGENGRAILVVKKFFNCSLLEASSIVKDNSPEKWLSYYKAEELFALLFQKEIYNWESRKSS